MSDARHHDAKTWNVGGTPVMRAEDFERMQAEEREAQLANLGEVTRRYQEAQRAYFEALHSIPKADLDAVRYAAATATASAAAPPAQPVDELLDHNYDGIQEYDNPTPGWWYWILWATVAYSVLHVAVVHFTPESVWKTPRQQHAVAEARALERQFAELNTIPMGEAKILQIMAQPKWLEQGESIFRGTCALCHGQQGEGLIGPNLTDEVYKTANITTLFDLANIVVTGAANGAMPSQKNVLNENEIALVAAYVASLRGKNLPGPRGPEGEPIAPWPTLSESGEVIPAEGGDPQASAAGRARP